jgi:hypothetical protein
MPSNSNLPADPTQRGVGYLDRQLVLLSLSESRKEIRLLKIVLGETDSTISITTSIISLYEKLDWDALSYCWGDPNDTRLIIVDNMPFNATRNLESALRQLRSEGYAKRIDAICINQRDVNEKNWQVPLMRDVYMLAERV